MLGLLPSLLSGVVSALFMAHERMDLPAGVTVFSTISKVVLGLGVLLLGWGYVGLAAVSIVTNVATLTLLAVLYGVLIGWPRPSIDPRVVWLLVGTSFPLMVNGLLNQLFFKIDVLLLKPLAGDLALGWYSTAYKLIDGLQVIPASFVIALFPLLARYAQEDRRRMARLGETGLKVLAGAGLPDRRRHDAAGRADHPAARRPGLPAAIGLGAPDPDLVLADQLRQRAAPVRADLRQPAADADAWRSRSAWSSTLRPTWR